MPRKPLSVAPAIALVALVYATCGVIAMSSFATGPHVGAAIAFDLIITATALFWLVAVRPGHARPQALIRVAVLGFALAKLLVGFGALGVVGVVAELALVLWLAVRIRRILRRVRAERRLGYSLPMSIDTALGEVMPRVLASILAAEVSATLLGLTGWFRRAPAGFTMHRRSSAHVVFGVVGALAIVETIVLHVIVAHWSHTGALVITGLSIYGMIWMLGILHAVRLAPLRLVGDELVIERGFVQRVVIPRSDIVEVTPTTTRAKVDLSYLEPSVELVLRAPARVHGLFGQTRLADRLTISVDDVDGFLATIRR